VVIGLIYIHYLVFLLKTSQLPHDKTCALINQNKLIWAPFFSRYIEIVKEKGLEICQPALDPNLIEIHHRIIVRARTKKVLG